MKVPIEVTVNGRQHRHEVEPRLLLVDYLRETLNLTGAKIGCDTSQCGSCTVDMNGSAMKSCTCLAVQADGSCITTIEGLAGDDDLHPIQEAFWNKHGLQCGFCTPGMIMATNELLRKNPSPSEEEVRHGWRGTSAGVRGTRTSLRPSRKLRR